MKYVYFVSTVLILDDTVAPAFSWAVMDIDYPITAAEQIQAIEAHMTRSRRETDTRIKSIGVLNFQLLRTEETE